MPVMPATTNWSRGVGLRAAAGPAAGPRAGQAGPGRAIQGPGPPRAHHTGGCESYKYVTNEQPQTQTLPNSPWISLARGVRVAAE